MWARRRSPAARCRRRSQGAEVEGLLLEGLVAECQLVRHGILEAQRQPRLHGPSSRRDARRQQLQMTLGINDSRLSHLL